jgi:hypothetical protein
MEEAKTSQINIFPNPTKGFITIEITNPLEYSWNEIYVVNLSGFIVYEASIDNVSDKFIKIDLSKLNSGTYFIRLLNEKYYSEGEKIIIQH